MKLVKKSLIIKASIWSSLGYILTQLTRLIGNLLLTRLLVPEYFGVMGIVSIVYVGLYMFSDLGIRQNVIQSSYGEDNEFLDTAWTIQIIRGFLIAFLMLFVSGILYIVNSNSLLNDDIVYSDPMLPLALSIISIQPIIQGFESINISLQNRNLALKNITYLEIISQTSGTVLMVVLAYYYHNIWSLISGMIFGTAVKTVMSYFLVPGRLNHLRLTDKYVHEIIRFGKWIILSSISGFFLSQGDRLLLGGLVGPETLGIYTIAYFLASSIYLALNRLTQSVFLPALSNKARNNSQQLIDAYFKIRKHTDIISFFVAGALFVSGQEIINLMYDNRYEDAGWMLEILGFSTIGIAVVVIEQVFLAIGKSKWMSMLSIIQLTILYIGLPICYYHYNLYGAIWLISISFAPKYLISLLFLKNIKMLSLKQEFKYFPLLAIGMLCGYLFNISSQLID